MKHCKKSSNWGRFLMGHLSPIGIERKEMTVFKTFLKILNKNKFVVLLYTIILLIFGVFNMTTSENNTNFIAVKPDILIINKDEEIGLTKNLVDYIRDNSNIINIKLEDDSINDALFYRDVNYIIYIPENYRQTVLNGEKPEIQIKSTGDYQSSYAEMLLSRYIKIQNIYSNEIKNEAELIEKINNGLENETQIEVTSKLDTNSLSKASFYYNFASYSILAGAIYVICLILSSFNEKSIRKRTIISSMNYKKHNRILLLSNGLFATALWLFYVIISFIIVGETMFSTARTNIHSKFIHIYNVCLNNSIFNSNNSKQQKCNKRNSKCNSTRLKLPMWSLRTSRMATKNCTNNSTYNTNILVHSNQRTIKNNRSIQHRNFNSSVC